MSHDPGFNVELTVDNQPVEMNEFVQKITGNILWAIVKSLRLDKEPSTATFKISVK